MSGLNLNGSGTVDGEGTVDLTSGRTGSATNARTLTLDTLDGDGGTFVVDTNINNDTDRIVINGEASGDHKLDVKASGGEPSQAAMNNFIVRQNGGTASFSLANEGGKVDAGLYLYELASRDLGSSGNPDGREWYLQRSAGGEKSPTGETVLGLSGMASAYAMYMGQLSDLRERLGEIRHGTGTDGLWVRGFTQENTLSGLAGIDFSQNFYGTSFGYDRLVEQNENNKWLFGVRGQLTKADQRIDGLHDGSGDSRSYGLAAYATWQHGDGWYSDTVLSWDWYDQDLKTRMLDGTRVHGSYNTYGGGISQEFGRMFRFDDGFFVEPQLQLSWYWMKGTDFTTSNGMKVEEQDDAYALTGRAGLVLGKKWDLDEGRYFQPYIKGGVNHEFAGDQKVLVNGIEFSDDLRGTRGYYGAGFDLQFASNARLYAEFEREDGQKASTPWSVSAGLRVEF
ncbi:autotransporter outer membrane beta-barrel domain-containing protein [Desulfovibrio piger]|uniref:autotransporter outer membrane beta-barrel domain-containing protein n=1 Tax=Desulfovibrio piger TaxID=901 RepID=UPI0026663722|nr:autotransporter outer membrane beta-barrel domain-containing protein [Desulfovibrio piger]